MNKKLLPFLLTCLLLVCSAGQGFAICKAYFTIHRISNNSFYLTDSSICNKFATSYTLIINNGFTTVTKKFDALAFSYNTNNIIITKNGTTTVTLKLYDSTGSGCQDSTSRTIVISGIKYCGAKFTYSALSGKQVSFYNQFNNNQYTKYYMDFGDNATSSIKNPVHTYANCGTFSATLRVSDSVNNCADTFTLPIPLGVIADFSYYEMGNKHNFNNNARYNGYALLPDTQYVAYHWEFGDGDTSNEFQPIHHYSSAGSYTAKLVMHNTNPNNTCAKSDSITKSVIVSCYVSPYFTATLSGTQTYILTNTSSGNNLKYLWRFGDTTTSTMKSLSHTFKTHGRYKIELVVMDSINNCRDSAFIYVGGYCTLKADLVLVYDSLHPYQATLYNYSSGSIDIHHWDFGDGSTSNSSAPVHNYTKTGLITLTYIAKDIIAPCSDTVIITFTIDSSGNLKRKAFSLTVVDRTNGQVGIHQISKNNQDIKIYPNPFVDEIMIQASGEIKAISIVNIIGQEIATTSSGDNGKYIVRFNKSTDRGIYFVKVENNEGVQFFKVLKE